MRNLKKGAFIENVNGTKQQILALLVDDLYAVRNEVSGEITIQQFSNMGKMGFKKIEEALEVEIITDVAIEEPIKPVIEEMV